MTKITSQVFQVTEKHFKSEQIGSMETTMHTAQVDKRFQLQHILFLIDFSAASERVLPFVREIAGDRTRRQISLGHLGTHAERESTRFDFAGDG